MDCDNAMIIPRILGSIIPCNNQWKQPLLKPISTICCQKTVVQLSAWEPLAAMDRPCSYQRSKGIWKSTENMWKLDI